MRFDFLVAYRFLKEGRMQSVLILLGIAVGIAVQIFLSSLIGGLQKDLIDKTVGTSPHITAIVQSQQNTNQIDPATDTVIITKTLESKKPDKPLRNWRPIIDQISQDKRIKAISPTITGSGFISSGEKNLPIQIKGFDLKAADKIYKISSRLKAGNSNVGGNKILLGRDLADEFKIGVGNIVRIGLANGTQDLFTVEGIFDLESQQLNKSWVILSIPRAQALFDLQGGITSLELQVTDIFAAENITTGLQKSFANLEWTSWQTNNASLLSALSAQSSSTNVIQALVLLAVTMGISSVLAVSAIQKTKQIGILKALGTKTFSVTRIFLFQGAVLGFIGSLLGCFLGWALSQIFTYLTATMIQTVFILDFSWQLFVGSIIIATLAGTIAAAIPARKSARLSPIEVIRNG